MQKLNVTSDLFIQNVKFASLNKNDSLVQYEYYTFEEEDYYTSEVKIEMIVTMTGEEFENFSNDLLANNEWMKGHGGNSSHYQMPEQYKDVDFFGLPSHIVEEWRKEVYCHGIAVVNEETKNYIIVDPQGYTYARYVGFTEDYQLSGKLEEFLQEMAIKQTMQEIEEEAVTITEDENGGFQISNKNCSVSYDPEDKDFSGSDLLDMNNLPRFYNQTKRSHKRAANALKEEFTKETTMYQAMSIICANGVRCRSYCAMD